VRQLVARESPAGKEVTKKAEDIIGIHYQAKANENTEDLAGVTERNKVREFVIVL
jgi:hypothetical protein